ncbi:hypothetical protein FC52_GL001227 [Lactobacillus pasteurii DSM 23907 = CRBIP 24.76]|uniref:Protein from nitrogen regulatory protein P-II (GLNB) family n=1 Tax=Lactobacillus pasteurii DSM 23907 = CRBIP 24.76 TaxID=1423790 RepID=I7IZP0_9LACO|nr:cyclic-di-AMP receptor [Lactobacillus pasteurii]KRK08108.1 hypothetical protein FC52_GL001227 [Lactobacillus pasteurii DSM 23907 = CRBIP 24.76]TDG76060.1 hypothetical protein C5L33_001618 [Lactobacillus pasteurii]CCI85232.1 Putative uncharacterized protein [Lactobacillus pasteurii DSM 23907 = CRBIP 24.76]
MKLIVAIVQKEDSNKLQRAFVENNVRATKLATTGGFLSQGNTTFLIGIDDEQVDKVLEIIKDKSQAREEYVQPNLISSGLEMSQFVKVTVGGATCFVLPVDQFEQF